MVELIEMSEINKALMLYIMLLFSVMTILLLNLEKKRCRMKFPIVELHVCMLLPKEAY